MSEQHEEDLMDTGGQEDHAENDDDKNITPEIMQAFPTPEKLMSFSESLVGGDELPEAIERALHAQPVRYTGDQGGDMLTAYPGLHYIHYETRIPGGIFEDDSYLPGADLWLSYFTSQEEAQASTDQALTRRRDALAGQAESRRSAQELEAWREDFRLRLSAAREKLNTYKQIAASGELSYVASRELEDALRLHEDDYVMTHYYADYQDMDGVEHPSAKIIDALRPEDRDKVEAYLSRISDTTGLEELLARLREETGVENKGKGDRQASWNEARALASALYDQTRGLKDAIYSAVRRQGVSNPDDHPDYLEAIEISTGLNAINRQGRGGVDGRGVLQELDPAVLSDDAEIIVSGDYIQKIHEIIERLHDLERQMNALKAKHGI